MSEVARYLREHKQHVLALWEKQCKHLPGAEALPRGTLIDHLPEFLEGMASWIEGDQESHRRLYDLLAEGHAAQRAGYGVPLQTLTAEYTVLRRVVLRELVRLEPTREMLDDVVQFNEAMDEAISHAVQRFTTYRDRLRERFIGILGHDLRNPLGSVTMSSAGILAWTRDDRTRRFATVIHRSAERMARMIKSLSDFTRAHLGGHFPVDVRWMDMLEVAEEAAIEIRAANPERDVTIDIQGDVTGVWDRDRLLQLMSNLLGNAVQHGREPIRMTIHEDEDHQSVTMRVSNAGEPIPADALPALFDPFRGGKRGGLGLGLYIVQQIAIAHGTKCTVRSDGGGTEFSIRWPRTPRPEVPDRT